MKAITVSNNQSLSTLRPMPLLIKTVQALQAKAIKAEGKAHDLWITIGCELKEAKARHKEMGGDLTWPEFAKKHFNFGQSRADELIRIADGRTTVEKVRASGAARVQKTRANPALRNAGSSEVVRNDGDDLDDESEVAPPEVVEDNILYGIARINENARVFNKILKASALDREAAERISTEINRMIHKWRSILSTLERKQQHTSDDAMVMS